MDYLNPRVRNNIFIRDLKPAFISLKDLLFPKFLNILGFGRAYFRIKNIGVKNTLIRYITEFTGIPYIKYSNIGNGLAVGMQPSKLGLFFLKVNGYNAILNLRGENYYNPGDKFESAWIQLMEYHAPNDEQFRSAISFITLNIVKGNKVYIHCREGVSRAPLFAIAFLMDFNGYTYEEAQNIVRSVRPFINILENQKLSISSFFEL